MPILFSEGVVKGRISLNEFVALTSTNHARIYGLTNKGSIAPGFDADIVLWDAEREVTISQSLMHHGADYTPWEGYDVTGWPHATILRGEVVMQEGEILGRRETGRFLPRALSPMAARGAGAPLT
jgi:dihydropyrimidinase